MLNTFARYDTSTIPFCIRVASEPRPDCSFQVLFDEEHKQKVGDLFASVKSRILGMGCQHAGRSVGMFEVAEISRPISEPSASVDFAL